MMNSDSMSNAIKNAGLDPDSDEAQGTIWMRYAESGKPRRDWYLRTFDVTLAHFGDTWMVQGSASGDVSTPFDLKIDIAKNTALLKLSFDGKHHEWNLDLAHPNIQLLLGNDPDQLFMEVKDNFTFYGNYNLMNGSQLLVHTR